MHNFTVDLPASSTVGNATEEATEEDNAILAVMGMLAFFSVLGTAGNAMVLYVYVRKRHKLAATVFIISLATTDFITCLIVVPYTIVVEYIEYNLQYDIVCKLYMFFITSNVPFAAFIMVAIAIDRYLCIVHPFKHLMNAKRAKYITMSLAGCAFSLGIITSLNYGVYQLQYSDKNSSVPDVSSDNTNSPDVVYNGICLPTEVILSAVFTNTYQKIYTALFLIPLLVVIVLYAMVYRSVLVRRAKRRKQRRSTRSISLPRESWFSEYRASFANGSAKHASEPGERHPDAELARQMTIRERGLIANIRTAAMLFVVTAVFIIAFLPAWLMAHEIVNYNMVVFYMYFSYNVANPLIYAFMNKAFRRDLRDVFDCKAVLRNLY